MPTPFRDFIPEGENAGALGSGFRDFVPTPEPKKEAPTEGQLHCEQCDFTTTAKIALVSHKKTHKK